VLEQAAELAVTGLLAVRMVVVGFLQPPGRVLSWPMFTRGCATDVRLRGRHGGDWEDINLFALLPSHHPAITIPNLQTVVDYLGERYDVVEGGGKVFFGAGTAEVRIIDGHVAV
jgi:hypothetical protein